MTTTKIPRCPRPQSETGRAYKIVYPIWREDMAEALLIPNPEPKRQLTISEIYGEITIE